MLKTAERSATLSFCPSGPFLAAGSVSGAISLSFDSSSTLEVGRRGSSSCGERPAQCDRLRGWRRREQPLTALQPRSLAPERPQIFRLDFASPDHDLKLAGGAVQAPERFARLCWGPPTPGSKDYPVRRLRRCRCRRRTPAAAVGWPRLIRC